MLIQHLPLLSSQRIVLASASPRRAEVLRSLGLKIEVIPSTFAENLEKSAFTNPGEYAVETALCKAIDVSRRTHMVSRLHIRTFDWASHFQGEVFLYIVAAQICLHSVSCLFEVISLHSRQHISFCSSICSMISAMWGCDLVVDGGKRPDLVIGADTIVELNGKILEKPQDERDAFNMLSSLSGCQHRVFTGVSLVVHPSIPDLRLGDPPLVRTFWEETKVEFANIEEAAINAYIHSGEPMDKAGAYGIQGIGGTFVKSIIGCFFNVMGFPIHRFSAEIDHLVKSGAFER